MSNDILQRSFNTEPVVTGRTLEGIALQWEKAFKVTDNQRDYYLEAFSKRSTDKQLNERTKPFMLGFLHPWATTTGALDKRPLGNVTFQRSAEGLVFVAQMSKTVAADEMLELVKDGSVTDVSVGFRNYKQTMKGDVVLRTEIGLSELSLAPTGFGQHEGSQVLAVRANTGFVPMSRLEASRKLATLKLWLPQ